MSVFLVRESYDVQCDGVASAIAAREKALAAECAADSHRVQPLGHVAERHRVQLAFNAALATGFRLPRTVHERALESGNADWRVTEFCTLRERRGERQPIVAGVCQA